MRLIKYNLTITGYKVKHKIAKMRFTLLQLCNIKYILDSLIGGMLNEYWR